MDDQKEYGNCVYHFVAASDENGDSSGIGAFFDDEHLISGSAKRNFTNDACMTQFLWSEVFEPRHNTTICCDCNKLQAREIHRKNCRHVQSFMKTYLDLGTSHPPNSRQLILHQQMIRFIIKSPLTNHQIRSGILHPPNHLLKLLLLILPQFLIFLYTRDIQFMLCFWAGRFERTGEDGEFGVTDRVGHLGVGHVFVDEDAFDEGGVGEGTSDFTVDFDEIEGNVFSV